MKQFLRSTISLLLLLLFIGAALPAALGQAVTVQGRVSGAAGEGLPGATVLEKGTPNATATDASGRYSLSLSGSKAVLVFSFTGYQTRELTVKGQTTLDIELKTGGAVAVGYGTRPQAGLTGAIATLPGEALTHSPAFNVTQNLAGRIPGLMAIGSGGGEPGNDGAQLLVRGINSFGSTQPLIVIDGVPGRSLQRLDPNTIESISVLKDASAAIYGMQAANGVILVTTKRGQAGKPAFSASFNQGLARPTRLPEMADAATYSAMLNELDVYKLPVAEWTAATQAYQTTGVYTRPDGTQQQAPFSPVDIRQYANGSDPWGHPNTDWFDAVMKSWAAQHQGNLSVSGGGKRLQYYAALSSRGQEGFFRQSDARFDQRDFRTNLDGQVNRHIRLGLHLMGRMEDRQDLQSTDRLFQMAMRSKPNHTAYFPDGSPGPPIGNEVNPVVATTRAMGDNQKRKYVANTNFYLDVAIPWIKGLSLTGNAAIDKGINRQEIKGANNASFTDNVDNNRFLLNGRLKYEKLFLSHHTVLLLAGVERLSGSFNQTSTSYYPFPGPPGNFDTNPGSSSFLQVGISSQKAFGRMHYGFKQKYLTEFTWAYQATSTFGRGYRSGFFPGVSVGYVLSAENFWQQHLSAVNYFKLRASYGQTGYDPFAIGSIWSATGTDDVAKRDVSSGEGGIAHHNFTWQKALQRNIGFDAHLLGQQLSVTADYFNYRHADIIRQVLVPGDSRLLLKTKNDGKASNRGFDLGIHYRPEGRQQVLNYEVGLTAGHAKNRVISIDETPGLPDYQRITGHPFSNTPYPWTNRYYQATGIYQGQPVREDYQAITRELRPGDILFRDVNKDGKINSLDQVRSDKTNIPTWTGGFTLRLGYKGFDFSALVQGAAGAVAQIPMVPVLGDNYLQSFSGARWTPQNPNASAPRAFTINEYWTPGNAFHRGNTYWLHKTDYLRLKQIELGYSLSKFTQKYGIEELRLYVNGYNLLTYSPDYKDFDPELNTESGHPFPLLKIINGGLSLTL